MSEIVADPADLSCYLLFSGFGIEQLNRLILIPWRLPRATRTGISPSEARRPARSRGSAIRDPQAVIARRSMLSTTHD
jgi:hypothetical protein